MENEPERGIRCTMCFDMRFVRTALYAHENGFAVISSSLGISRWKDMNQINDCGHRADDNGDRRLLFGRGAGLLGRKVAGHWRLWLSVLRPARLWLTVVWRLRLRRLVILRLPILRLTIRRSVRHEKSPSYPFSFF